MVTQRKMFTLEEARRALPLVRRIAADMQIAVDDLTKLPGGTSFLYGASPLEDLSDGIRHRAGDLHTRIMTLTAELTEIGVELKGFQPVLVDFPTRREEQVVYLCWAEGESDIGFWHPLTEGFRSRQPL